VEGRKVSVSERVESLVRINVIECEHDVK